MNIVVTAFAYNEVNHISYMVKYYREQGCDLFIMDNYSNDGTYEWLIENNVNTVRIETDDSFHLTIMQESLIEILKIRNPDWLIYTGVDTYFIFPNRIADDINDIDRRGYNTIQSRLLEVFNTGEEVSFPFYRNYFYGKFMENREMVVKYHKSMGIDGDRLIVPNKKSINNGSILINYGMCKSKEERETTLARRRKAWKMGLNKGFGTHYLASQKNQWKWERDKLTDIRTIDKWDIIKKALHNGKT